MSETKYPPKYWQCPRDESHPIEFFPRWQSRTMRCSICEVAAILDYSPVQKPQSSVPVPAVATCAICGQPKRPSHVGISLQAKDGTHFYDESPMKRPVPALTFEIERPVTPQVEEIVIRAPYCEDEGCPHHGTPHVCLSVTPQAEPAVCPKCHWVLEMIEGRVVCPNLGCTVVCAAEAEPGASEPPTHASHCGHSSGWQCTCDTNTRTVNTTKCINNALIERPAAVPQASADEVQAIYERDAPAAKYPVPVVCAVILRGGRVLLERRATTGVEGLDRMWDVPGGKMEKDETPQQAIAREIDEEQGLQVSVESALPLRSSTWVYHGKQRYWLLVPYVCSLISGTPKLTDDLKWWPVDALPKEMLAADREMVRDACRPAQASAGLSDEEIAHSILAVEIVRLLKSKYFVLAPIDRDQMARLILPAIAEVRQRDTERIAELELELQQGMDHYQEAVTKLCVAEARAASLSADLDIMRVNWNSALKGEDDALRTCRALSATLGQVRETLENIKSLPRVTMINEAGRELYIKAICEALSSLAPVAATTEAPE